MTDLTRRLLRALKHSIERNHDFAPITCWGCREVAAFLTIPGYQGDVDDPVW
jgi:hypothetical protein